MDRYHPRSAGTPQCVITEQADISAHYSPTSKSEDCIEGSLKNYDKIKICFITSNDQNTGSTRLRVFKLVDGLKKLGVNVAVNANYADADILVFQKSKIAYLNKIFTKFVFSDKLLIFDIDDLYKGSFLNLITYSDIVITSTKKLKDFYKKYNKNTFILDNIIDVNDTKIPLKGFNLQCPSIGWFGVRASLRTLKITKLENIIKITEKGYGDIEWNLDTIDENIQKLDLVLLPQIKDSVGFSKTNNRLIKSIYLGRPTMVSNVPEYTNILRALDYPEFMILDEHEDWGGKIDQIRTGEYEFNFNFTEARKKILNRHGKHKIAKDFLDIVRKAYFIRNKKRKKLLIFTKLSLYTFFYGVRNRIWKIIPNIFRYYIKKYILYK